MKCIRLESLSFRLSSPSTIFHRFIRRLIKKFTGFHLFYFPIWILDWFVQMDISSTFLYFYQCHGGRASCISLTLFFSLLLARLNDLIVSAVSQRPMNAYSAQKGYAIIRVGRKTFRHLDSPFNVELSACLVIDIILKQAKIGRRQIWD